MPNVAREMASYPKPSLKWGQNLASESLTDLQSSNRQLKAYLGSQMVTGNVAASASGKRLNKIAQNIILDTDTLDAFFEKLAEFSMTSSSKSTTSNATSLPAAKPVNLSKGGSTLPETRQFMDYGSGGELQKTVIQNPIQRSMDNVGHPQPIFPNKAF
jgi:hypothetical protein